MYKPIYTLQELQNYLADASVVAFDFETAPDEKYRNEDKAALDAHKSHIVGISFSVAEESGVYLSIAHRVGQNAERLTEIWTWLAEFFNSTYITKIAHNLAFESQFLYAQGIVIQEPCYDTIAAAQLVHKNEKEFRSLGDCGLKTLVPEYFHEPLPSYAETVGGLHFDELDPQSEKTVRYACADSDYTVSPDAVRAEFENAKLNPANENTFRRLNLNQWVKQSTRWMPMELWDKCDFPVDTGFLQGKKCYAGLDLSKTQDLTAFVLVFPPDDPSDEEDKYRILPFFWIPEEALQRRVLKDHVPYDQWLAQGLIETTDGAVINYNFVQQKIEELAQIYDIKEIAFDRWGATMLTQNLRDAGLTIVDFGQGYKSMSPPMEELMRLVLSERIAHGGNKVLRWNFDNIVVMQDEAGNIKPDKKRATEKIDGAVAMIMALDRAIVHEDHESVYDKRGMLVVDLNHPDGYYYINE